MAFGEANKVVVTCDAEGSAVAYLPAIGSYTGRIISLSYEKGNFEDGVDFEITSEPSDQTIEETIWEEANVNDSAIRYPCAPVHAADGTESGAYDYIMLVNQRIKISVTNGGNGTTGTFYAKIG